MPRAAVPARVLGAYGFTGASLTPITIGLINLTFQVDRQGERFILQRLHPAFSGVVNDDIDALTRHLVRRGMPTPTLLRASDGASHVSDEAGRPWRALTYVEGRCVHEIRTRSLARAAGALAGRFTRATSDFEHRFAFTRPGAHDTARHLARLEEATREALPDDVEEARALAREILAHAAQLPSVEGLPRRVVHGDLKASNLLFYADRDEGLCLVDLDTIAHGTVLTEMGDALRSWTNPKGEDDARGEVDVELFEAAVSGYLEEAGALLVERERMAFSRGLETIALELASRFCLDAIEDRYFGWNASRYPSRRAHNLVRTRSQLSLARSACAKRAELDAIVRAIG